MKLLVLLFILKLYARINIFKSTFIIKKLKTRILTPNSLSELKNSEPEVSFKQLLKKTDLWWKQFIVEI